MTTLTQISDSDTIPNEYIDDLTGEIIYPNSDGLPMAENTKQYDWITTIKGGLDITFANRTDVFVASDLFWYALEEQPQIRTAPDTMVVFGRPKGHRGSYKQWEENNIAPQVVFEIISPSNSQNEIARKEVFYTRYGVQEFYAYDPESNELFGWIRENDKMGIVPNMQNWISPLLKIRFELIKDDLKIYYPNGEPFLTYMEINQQLEEERKAKEEKRKAKEEEQKALIEAQAEIEKLKAALKAKGIDWSV